MSRVNMIKALTKLKINLKRSTRIMKSFFAAAELCGSLFPSPFETLIIHFEEIMINSPDYARERDPQVFTSSSVASSYAHKQVTRG